MSIMNIERSFGELLAAFGDLVVARTRGAPADAAGGSTRALARSYRARRRTFDRALDGAGVGGQEGAGEADPDDDTRALSNMRATLPWLDELEPTPGARQTEGGATDEEPAVARALANYALSAIMAAAVRARIAERRGPWFEGDPGWYRFVADALFVPGSSRPPAVLVESFLGGPLTADPLLADLSRGG